MRTIYLTIVGLLFLMGGSLSVSAQVSNDNEDGVYKVDKRYANDFVPGQVLVKFKDASPVVVRRVAGRFQSVDRQSVNDVLKEFGTVRMEKLLPNEKPGRKLRRTKAYNGTVVQEHDLSQLYLVEMEEAQAVTTRQLVERLSALSEVEFAEPNYKVYLAEAPVSPDDPETPDPQEPGVILSTNENPLYEQQWGIPSYGVDQLWNKPIVNPKRPVIAIIDTGVDMTHPDIEPNLWTNTVEAEGEEGYDNDQNGFVGDLHGWDFINNTPNVRDFNSHGTHVAGIAAAANNGIGIIGANPQALIMPISVMQSDGSGDVATIIQGINYAVDNGANVLNLSLGGYAYSRAERYALENAYSKAVIVAAAGNNSGCINTYHGAHATGPMFPAAFSFVLGVQALQQEINPTAPIGAHPYLAKFSNYDDDGANFSQSITNQDPDGFNYELNAPGDDILSTYPGGRYVSMNGTSMASPLVAGAISALLMVKEYDTQEILWGDLINTNNIAEAYAVEERPAELQLMGIMWDERKELGEDDDDADYSGDKEIDAGETVSFYPIIRTTFGEASSITFHLEMGDELEDPSTVQFLTGEVDFGMHLDAYGRGVSLNPAQLKVANNLADRRHIKLKIVGTCGESTFEKPFVIIVNNTTKIGGLVSENRTLTADRTYYVNTDLGVMDGAMLTIEPGTRLEFGPGVTFKSFGRLNAKGTPEKPIVFTSHEGEEKWILSSDESHGKHEVSDDNIYTNADSTLFTMLPTEQTPNAYRFFGFLDDGVATYDYNLHKNIYNIMIYGKKSDTSDYYHSVVTFNFTQYLIDHITDNIQMEDEDWKVKIVDSNYGDFTTIKHLLTDPSVITPVVTKLLSDIAAYSSANESDPDAELLRADIKRTSWYYYDYPLDTLSYCRIENAQLGRYSETNPYMSDCVLYNVEQFGGQGRRNVITYCDLAYPNYRLSNIANGSRDERWGYVYKRYESLKDCNYINNVSSLGFWLSANSSHAQVFHSDHPSYLGTAREDLVRPHIAELGTEPGNWGQLDLSNMPDRPYAEAHGIVWKVVVNGKDAQDEYEDLAPLGVGKHKFEVYFNRPMNKAVAPLISFGVRTPWTQNAVDEEGSWNEDGTIYTAYKTITGKTMSDGVNRINVREAEDNEFFEIPQENSRFNINIQATGSMATGFMAEAGLGRVNLTWNNSENDFEDAMGFNIYRYFMDENGNVYNTIRLNEEILGIETTEYTDFNVEPGNTYYYMYKVLSTALEEFDVSNVVSATPMTSILGDANASGDVDVADVITTVNYAAGQNPKPFLFEAADVNTDLGIDILDVVGIIQLILHPSSDARMQTDATAVYTVEDGVLYVESPVALAGVQVQLNHSQWTMDSSQPQVAADLKGFEHTSVWLSDNDYLFLAYNLNGKTLSPGKHALLLMGDADLSTLRLSDAFGHNVRAEAGEGVTAIDAMGAKVLTQSGIFNLKGQKVASSASALKRLPRGVYIVNGEKVVK